MRSGRQPWRAPLGSAAFVLALTISDALPVRAEETGQWFGRTGGGPAELRRHHRHPPRPPAHPSRQPSDHRIAPPNVAAENTEIFVGIGYRKQHFLYFFPLPQGHGSLRPAFSYRGDARVFC